LPKLFIGNCEPSPPCSWTQPQPNTREPMPRRSRYALKSGSGRKRHPRGHGWTLCFGWAGRLRKLSNPHLPPLPRATGQIMPSDLAERFVEGSRSSEGLGQTLGAQGPTMPPICGTRRQLRGSRRHFPHPQTFRIAFLLRSTRCNRPQPATFNHTGLCYPPVPNLDYSLTWLVRTQRSVPQSHQIKRFGQRACPIRELFDHDPCLNAIWTGSSIHLPARAAGCRGSCRQPFRQS
jgi:hypothetical protein